MVMCPDRTTVVGTNKDFFGDVVVADTRRRYPRRNLGLSRRRRDAAATATPPPSVEDDPTLIAGQILLIWLPPEVPVFTLRRQRSSLFQGLHGDKVYVSGLDGSDVSLGPVPQLILLSGVQLGCRHVGFLYLLLVVHVIVIVWVFVLSFVI